MPELSRFYGIVIKLFFDDHPPPHFHATYGEHEALVRIEPLGVIAGTLPPRAMGLVIEWASLHQPELKGAWERARNLETPDKIAPLP
jgi:hypothetical protein